MSFSAVRWPLPLVRHSPRLVGQPVILRCSSVVRIAPAKCQLKTPILRRSFSSPISTDSIASSIIFSKDQPADLPERVSKLSNWTLTPSKMGLSRQFTFPSFSKAWKFMTIVAERCKAKRHHPSWHNLYNKVTIEWTTHDPLGLSIKDVEMAEFCDQTANEIGLKKENA